jgi:hypothetical protein
MLYFSMLLHCIDLTLERLCCLWPSSGVEVVVVKDSAAYYNAVFFPSIVVASGCFGYVRYHQFYLGALGLHVVASGFVRFVRCGCFECSCWGGSSVVCWPTIIVLRCIFMHIQVCDTDQSYLYAIIIRDCGKQQL